MASFTQGIFRRRIVTAVLFATPAAGIYISTKLADNNYLSPDQPFLKLHEQIKLSQNEEPLRKKSLYDFSDQFKADLKAARATIASKSPADPTVALDQWLEKQAYNIITSLQYKHGFIKEYEDKGKTSMSHETPLIVQADRLITHTVITDDLPVALEPFVDEAQSFFENLLRSMGFSHSSVVFVYDKDKGGRFIIDIGFPVSSSYEKEALIGDE
ncbi:hypothetical protein TWF696_008085 [Orbilia brochopaga]|uniref:Uncharacterized protein n=1 Tax=Orbilia brochopaga TaxID=3140254 RepID=A0AAV9URK5_9PEZI